MTPKIAVVVAGVLFTAACQTTEAVRIDSIPKYGQPEVVRPARLRQADEDFIKEAMKGFSTRRQASAAWFQEGERYLAEGNIDYAMRRYNQSWLLDPTNFQPYWGFGRILLEQDKRDEAVEQLEAAVTRVDNPKYEVALLVDTATAYAYNGERFAGQNMADRAAANFSKANETYARAEKLQPYNGNIYRRWAIARFLEKDYPAAWFNVKRARELGARPLPGGFMHRLSSRMPEPR